MEIAGQTKSEHSDHLEEPPRKSGEDKGGGEVMKEEVRGVEVKNGGLRVEELSSTELGNT
jgi:hypothetical protein